MTPTEKTIRQKLKNDLFHYARKALTIVKKQGQGRLEFNSAQKLIHSEIERMLAETGMVRVLILKGRQQGASTYTEARFFWKTTHNFAKNTLVLCDKGDTSEAVFKMVRLFYDDCPSIIKPSISANSTTKLFFHKLNSGFTVGSAGGKGTTGRGKTVHYLHGSEVAYWENEEEIVTGALQTVPPTAGSEVILESTANGAQGLFHRMCIEAQKEEGDYRLIFVPWFLQTEYARPKTDKVKFSMDDLDYQKRHQLTDEQMSWRFFKIKELGSIPRFRREYPATVEEAFMADVSGALWTRNQIHNQRVSADDLPRIVRKGIGLDPATTNNKNSDNTGIVLIGLGEDGHAYVLGDYSGKWSVTEWANIVNDLYREHDCDFINAETNQGGDMVMSALYAVNPTLNVQGIHVRESKRVRHEHVHAQYVREMVHHVGELSELEDQMCAWVPHKAKYSPDRVDALSLAIQELMLEYDDSDDFFIMS